MIKKKYFKYSVQFLITAILIYVIVKYVYIRDVLNHIRNIKITYFILGFILFIIACSINVLKWKYILYSNNRFIKYLSLFKYYLYTFFYNLFLPGSNSSDLLRTIWLKKNVKSYTVSLWSIFWERFSGMTAMAVFALIGIFLTDKYVFPNNTTLSVLGFSLFIIIVFVLLLLNDYYSEYLINIVKSIANKIGKFQKLFSSLVNIISIKMNITTGLVIMLISITAQFITVFYHYLLGISLGIEVSFYVYLIVVPLISFVKIIPWTINSIGVRETTFMVFFAFFGVSNSQSVAIGLLAFSIQVLTGIVMGGVHLFDTKNLSLNDDISDINLKKFNNPNKSISNEKFSKSNNQNKNNSNLNNSNEVHSTDEFTKDNNLTDTFLKKNYSKDNNLTHNISSNSSIVMNKNSNVKVLLTEKIFRFIISNKNIIFGIILFVTLLNFFYNGYYRHLRQNVFYDFRALYNAAIEAKNEEPNLYGQLIYRQTGYGYLPIITYVLMPFTLFEESTATIIWLHLNILLLFLSIWLMTKINKIVFNKSYIFLVSFFTLNFHPLFETIKWGQVNIILFVLILSLIYFYLKNNLLLTGFFLGLAIIFKIIPGMLVLYFLVRKKFSVVVYASITVIAFIILSITLFGVDLHKEYFFEKLPTASLHGYKGNIYDQSFQAMSFRLFWADNGYTNAWFDNFNLSKKISSFFRISSVIIMIIFLFPKKNTDLNVLKTLEILIVNTTIHLFHSLSWEHHFMLSIFLFICIFIIIKERNQSKCYNYYILLFISYFTLALRYGYDNKIFTNGILILFTGIKLYAIILLWVISLNILMRLKKNENIIS